MPELPELESLARTLSDSVVGRDVAAVTVRSVSMLKTYAPPIDALVGDTTSDVRRRGEHLLLGTRGARTLGIHLMTGGRLRRTAGKTGPARADGMTARFADGTDLRVSEIGSKKESAVHLVDGDGSLFATSSRANARVASRRSHRVA